MKRNPIYLKGHPLNPRRDVLVRPSGVPWHVQGRVLRRGRAIQLTVQQLLDMGIERDVIRKVRGYSK